MKAYLSILLLFFTISISAQTNYTTVKDISYLQKQTDDNYQNERCKVDIYYPVDKKDFSTIVWFHGGGLTGGEKYVPEEFMNKGIAVVAVNYRLSPKATCPAYMDDAAMAVAWAFNNIEKYGGNKERIFIAGHSAGGYLTLMLAFDKNYLNKYGIDADKVKAYFPISGQTFTHYTIRQERELPMEIPIVDEYAPINKARKNIPDVYLYTGERNKELAARYEENACLAAVLKSIGNNNVMLYELAGFDHGNVVIPAAYLIIQAINKYK